MNLKQWAARRRPARRFDCGSHGPLTVAEMIKVSGLSESSIRNRIARGVVGDRLIAPRQQGVRGNVDYVEGLHLDSVAANLHKAILIGRDFAARVPTVHELKNKYGMSRATAYRWRAAIAAANGVAA